MLRSVFTGLSALLVNPMRSVLSTLGVIIGVASLVAILALGDGLERFSREQLESTTDLQTVSLSAQTTDRIDGLLVQRDHVPEFTRSDLQDLLSRLDAPVAGFRMLVGSATIRPPDSTRDVGLLIRGVDTDALLSNRYPVLHGDLAAWHADADPPAAVLSRSTAGVLFPGGPDGVVGRDVRLGDRTVHVVAVLDGNPGARPLEVFVPLTSATMGWLGATGRVPSIILRADRIEDVDEITRAAEQWAIDRFPAGAVDVQSSRARVRQANQAMLVFKLGLASIAAISLLVGGIGIMNILLASVSERTREIGIRKSIGARGRDIRLQFLAESVAIAGVGSIIGVVVGMVGAVVLTAIIRSLTEAPVHAAFTWQSILVATGAALVVGLVFGTYPARKASRLSPIDAIRHE